MCSSTAQASPWKGNTDFQWLHVYVCGSFAQFSEVRSKAGSETDTDTTNTEKMEHPCEFPSLCMGKHQAWINKEGVNSITNHKTVMLQKVSSLPVWWVFLYRIKVSSHHE